MSLLYRVLITVQGLLYLQFRVAAENCDHQFTIQYFRVVRSLKVLPSLNPFTYMYIFFLLFYSSMQSTIWLPAKALLKIHFLVVLFFFCLIKSVHREHWIYFNQNQSFIFSFVNAIESIQCSVERSDSSDQRVASPNCQRIEKFEWLLCQPPCVTRGAMPPGNWSKRLQNWTRDSA